MLSESVVKTNLSWAHTLASIKNVENSWRNPLFRETFSSLKNHHILSGSLKAYMNLGFQNGITNGHFLMSNFDVSYFWSQKIYQNRKKSKNFDFAPRFSTFKNMLNFNNNMKTNSHDSRFAIKRKMRQKAKKHFIFSEKNFVPNFVNGDVVKKWQNFDWNDFLFPLQSSDFIASGLQNLESTRLNSFFKLN